MRPTAFGARGLAFHAAMVAAFWLTPYSNLFFLLLGFLTLVGAFGVAGALRNVRGLEAILPELPAVPTGTPVRVELSVRRPHRPRFGIEGRVVLAGGTALTGHIDVLERARPGLGDEAVVVAEAPALPRGVHRIEAVELGSTHPFGIVRARRPQAIEPCELVVYPSPASLVDGRSAVDIADELTGSTSQDGDLQPSSLRDHRDGEGIRGVHWRASARRGKLVVQEWEGGAGEGLEVLLDRRCAEAELEDALATTSALAELARTDKTSLRVLTQDLVQTFGDGHRPWHELLRFLALAQPLPPSAPGPPPASPGVTRLPRATAAGARP